MREILFRGKQMDTGKWICGYLVNDEISCISAIITYANLSGNNGAIKDMSEVDAYRIKPETISQFTGICDNKDKNIFEGDILRGSEKDDFGNFLSGWFGVVSFDEDSCRYIVTDDLGEKYDLDDFEFDKIVGNIFDNPELLKGE